MIEFQNYDEIPEILQNYLKTVANVKHISMLPLHEINSFIQGVEEYCEVENARLG